MKKSLFLLTALAAAATMASCNDDDPVAPERNPAVTLTKGAEAETSLTFTVTPEDADECRYIYARAEGSQTVPDAEQILATGTEVAADKATTVTLEDLDSGTEYVIAAAVRSGGKTAVASPLTMTTAAAPGPQPAKAVFASAALNSGSNGNYFIEFASDKYVLQLDFYADAASTYLPAATYTVTAEGNPGEIDSYYSRIKFLEQSTEEWVKLKAGSVDVKLDEQNEYAFTMNLTLVDDTAVEGEYAGKVEGMQFSADDTVEFTPTVADRKDNAEWGYPDGQYSISFHDNYTTHQGTLILFADPASESLPEGTYTFKEGTEPFSASPKSNVQIYSPYADYYFKSGTVTVSKNGDEYTIVIEAVDRDTDKPVKGSFTGEIGHMVQVKPVTFTSTAADRRDNAEWGYPDGQYTIKMHDNYTTHECTVTLFADPASESLPEGTYTVKEGTEPFSAAPNSNVQIYSPYADYYFKSGTVTVSKNGDEYTIAIETVDRDTDKPVKGSFTGEIGHMVQVKPVTFTPTVASRRDNAEWGYPDGQYSISFHDNYTTHQGTLILFADPASESLPEGTYTVKEGTEPFSASPKSNVQIYSPYADYYFKSGTVTVSKNGDEYTIAIETVDRDTDKPVKGSFTGKIDHMVQAKQ